MTRSIRTQFRRAIGLALALGVVIAPNALAKPFIGDSSGGVAGPASQSAGTIATPHDTWGAGPYNPYGTKASKQATGSYDPYQAHMRAAQGAGTVATPHDTWGSDRRPSAPSATITSSGSHETRNVLLAASGIGLLLIGGGSLVLMLRRRRAQLA